MAPRTMPEPALPAEAKAAIWRIFGAGESPLKKRSSYELIEPVIGKHASSTDPDWVISEIRGWFESYEDRRWLKSDMGEPVAVLIVKGVGTDRSGTAIWAIGSIEADLAARIIRSHWSPQEIDSFVDAVLTTLKKLCDRDEVLDAASIAGFDSTNAKIPKSSVVRAGRLETFRHLDNYGFELVHRGLHPAAGNLIALVIGLRPERFETLIERLDHPVMQARAAHHMVTAVRPLDHRKTLLWIKEGSCEAMVALAIVHTLNTVNRLDEELRAADRADLDQYTWSTELRPPQDDLNNAAANLLTGLMDRLAALDPLACAGWIGELLSSAPDMLHQRDNRNIPYRIEQLERICTELFARLVLQSWSDDLLAELRTGLCLTRRTTWLRHMADVAWEIRHVAPTRAAEIAQVTLDLHNQHIAEQLEQNRLFLDWSDWHSREWFSSLGRAFVLPHEDLDLQEWISAQCRELPLSVWDAEENYEAFIVADRAVQHWFLVALHAIKALSELGHETDSVAIRALAETLWTHCHFAGQYLHSHPEASVTVEYTARLAAESGKPNDDEWLLNQARNPGVGPRALWALIDQCKLRGAREGGMDAPCDEMVTKELVRIASDRFGERTQLDLETLRFLARLWFLLGAIDEAEQTAIAITAFPLRMYDRTDKILVLKLLALVSSRRKLAPEIADYPASFYSQLWPGHTPSEERADRQQIDELLKRSVFPIL